MGVLDELGLRIGHAPRGPRDDITDVAGVAVGHHTLDATEPVQVHTGVTAVLPHGGSLVAQPMTAASHVINGYGKTIGLLQIDELGILESPIVLTNTFAVGAGFDGIVQYLLDQDPRLRHGPRSLNPVVAECNDSWLSDMQSQPVRAEHVRAALHAATGGEPVAQGAVGAGRGMSLFDLKGGIGSASRQVELRTAGYTVGALVLGNFGTLAELTIAGRQVGRVLLAERGASPRAASAPGSVIVIVATDAPASSRQLRRLARRVQTGLARTGCSAAHGSGEIAIAFSTARRAAPPADTETVSRHVLVEVDAVMDPLFSAVAEATEAATLSALLSAHTVEGRDGVVRHGFPTARLTELLRRAGES